MSKRKNFTMLHSNKADQDGGKGIRVGQMQPVTLPSGA